MLRQDQRGVAALTVVIIVAVSAGATIATPVVVDVVDVDPDSPFYGLERLGEQIRMISAEDQMKERWGEYSHMVEIGKGLHYRAILDEFRDKMERVVPENVAAKQEVVQWMQEQMPGIGEVRLRLLKEFAMGIKEDLADLPDVGEEIENEIDEIEGYEEELPTATPERLENIRAHMRIFRERLEHIANQYPHMMHRPVDVYLDIDNTIVDIDVTINIEVNITIVAPPVNLVAKFDEKLAEFDEELAEVQTKIEELPENSYLKSVVEELVSRAEALRDRAVELKTTHPRWALFLLFRANALLNQAEMIIEHAADWVPLDWVPEWTQNGTWMENMMEWMENMPWHDFWEEQTHH